ncbi:MAG TPA: helicase HerA-like domain-containing protein [Solirubrobacteraceae bacterium]|jgi:hypothetical protein|nr:helicase HerA-like domain-containing protein [Solirubrobacteraceae bacterium]
MSSLPDRIQPSQIHQLHSPLSEIAVPKASGGPALDSSAALLAVLNQALERVVALGALVGVGVCAGALAVRLMRDRDLRWTWSLVPLAVLLPAGPLSPLSHGWAAAFGVASLYAAADGRRRHRDDLAAGGDLAERAGTRSGPTALLRGASLELAARCADRPRRVPARIKDGRLEVGRDESARPVCVPFGEGGGRHTLVVGATGSGKTVTQTWMVCRAIEAGLAAVVVDPKGDRRMRDALALAARGCGHRFLEWTPLGPTVYNPLARGGASEIADRALAGERFTEPHYLRQAQRYLGHAVRTLQGAGMAASFPSLVELLEPGRLELLSEAVAGKQGHRTREYLASLTARQRADLGGVRDRLAILAESDMARWLDPAMAGEGALDAGTFDLLGAIAERAVVYFCLQADSWPLLAQMLGAAVIGDLRSAMAALQRRPVATVAAIDEFAAIAAEQVAHLFGRARSAGINLVLGTQELSDLRVDGRGQLREQVLGNLSGLIAHRQVVADSVQLVSELGGSVGAWRTSRSSDGRWTQTRVQVPAISAERVRALPPGVAAVIDLADCAPVRLARVHMCG